MGIKTLYSCDVCNADMPSPSKESYPHKGDKKNFKMTVIFTTEQTEGRGTEPYLSEETLDICGMCLKRVLTGQYIWAHGAQGHNEFYFRTKQGERE